MQFVQNITLFNIKRICFNKKKTILIRLLGSKIECTKYEQMKFDSAWLWLQNYSMFNYITSKNSKQLKTIGLILHLLTPLSNLEAKMAQYVGCMDYRTFQKRNCGIEQQILSWLTLFRSGGYQIACLNQSNPTEIGLMS